MSSNDKLQKELINILEEAGSRQSAEGAIHVIASCLASLLEDHNELTLASNLFTGLSLDNQ